LKAILVFVGDGSLFGYLLWVSAWGGDACEVRLGLCGVWLGRELRLGVMGMDEGWDGLVRMGLSSARGMDFDEPESLILAQSERWRQA